MKRILLILFLTTWMTNLLGQKLEGVYVGEILSSGNVLMVKNKGSVVSGSIYLSQSDKLDFSGSYIDRILRGSIQLAGGGRVRFEAKLGNNPVNLLLSSDSSNRNKSRKLYKVSSSSKYKIANLFSDQNDILLLGRWETLKVTNAYGELVDGKFYWEFQDEGSCDHRTIVLRTRDASIPRPPGFNPYQVHQQGWATENGNLTISILSPAGTIANTYIYAIKGDTLITRSTTGAGVTYFIRK